LSALRQQRLLVEQVRPVADALFGLAGEAPDQRMPRVDLENRHDRRDLLPGGPQQPFEVARELAFADDQARGRFRQPVRDAHLLDLRAQRAGDALDQRLQLAGLALLLRLLGVVGERPEVEGALGDRRERLALVFSSASIHSSMRSRAAALMPFAKTSRCGVRRAGEGLGGHVVDRLRPSFIRPA
jgi:hypothetical protein